MFARKEGTHAEHSSGASLFDLLNLDDEENCSDELDEDTPSASAKRKLASFLSESGNQLCADCGSPDPKWVSANLGAFVCIKCSGAHRSLGVHISKILSVNLDEWTEEDVDNLIKLGGNTAVNLKYEDSIPKNHRKPQPDSSIDDRTDFIKRKYVMQQFLNPDEQLSCPFIPAAINCSSTGLTSVVEKKYLNSVRMHNFGQAFLNARRRKDAEQKKSNSTAGMVEFVGMIKVNVVSGTNLAIRDVRSSDPYVMLSLGNQSMKTRVIKNNLNPVWNEKLMFSIPSDIPPLKVNVFDKDKFSTDDFMGKAEIDIRPLVSAAKAFENGIANGPSKQLEKMDDGKYKNTLVNDGMITAAEGKIKQDIALKLQNVESGELQIEIECVALTQ
ncbi:hypothetical protein L1987_28796 [Smallanthus sonchifolius]|uniref:Uncharacterized protein n=1 Tax=Smallanthus sonchifolius TaxID=185202 RepID=A0ACB9HYR5_9ASTR|nr:hypothetical protein L1987_28796 [Smallanthus sonchifolius]